MKFLSPCNIHVIFILISQLHHIANYQSYVNTINLVEGALENI